jgi:hypothetical protein
MNQEKFILTDNQIIYYLKHSFATFFRDKTLNLIIDFAGQKDYTKSSWNWKRINDVIFEVVCKIIENFY